MNNKGLVWSPVKDFLKSQIESSETLLTIIAPFIQLGALKDLLSVAKDYKDLNIITRWRAEDLISGVSDIEIYPYLKDNNINLFYHDHIHLKLYVFDSDTAFSSSANITKKGLGDTNHYNIEIGSLVDIAKEDWFQINKLLQEATQVTDAIYQEAKKYISENKRTPPPLPKLELVDPNAKPFSLKSLPKTESPDSLYEYYSAPNSITDKESIKNYIHDLVLYNLDENLSKDDFFNNMKHSFTEKQFIKAIVKFIKAKCEERKDERKNGVRFGEMTDWLQKKCSDSPMPYRSEIKTDVRMLYNWLQFNIPEITWSQPNRSQIISFS